MNNITCLKSKWEASHEGLSAVPGMKYVINKHELVLLLLFLLLSPFSGAVRISHILPAGKHYIINCHLEIRY